MSSNNNFRKNAGAAALSLALLCSAIFVPPLQSRAEPTILSILVGGVLSSFGIDFFSCNFNIIFYCNEEGDVIGSDGGGSVVQEPCTSAANSCGQTNTGFRATSCTTGDAGPSGSGGNQTCTSVCSAEAPPNSTCPAPSILAGTGFYAQPNIVKEGDASTLHWSSTNTTGCTVTGDGGFSFSGGSEGSVSTGAISKTATFTLVCQNGDGGPKSSANIKVVVTPQFQEI